MATNPLGPDPDRTRLRTNLAAVAREIGRLPDDKTTADLRAAFAELDQQLALGPEPDLRECPTCKDLGMRNATICGSCWTRLVPPAEKTIGTA